MKFRLVLSDLEYSNERRKRRKTLGWAARTCKMFKDPALRSLWWELDGLHAVVVVTRAIPQVCESVRSHLFFANANANLSEPRHLSQSFWNAS